jgi:xanthine dehydrogenase accessory factor
LRRACWPVVRLAWNRYLAKNSIVSDPTQEIFEAILAARRSGANVVLATVIRTQGSVPRRAGAKMLIYPDGHSLGTIGGGEMESRILDAVPRLLQDGQPDILHYELADPSRGDPGVCGGQVDIFLEPILPQPTVLVIGCGHVGQAVADLAHWLGFRVVVSDDRAKLCNPEAIPQADEYLVVPPEQIAKQAPLHSRTYVAAVTRGVPFDVALLPALLETAVPYIGVIGSRRRWETALKELRAQGLDDEALRRVHSPIGLELGAETPREIAVSILAQIIAVQRGSAGEPMEDVAAPEKTR